MNNLFIVFFLYFLVSACQQRRVEFDLDLSKILPTEELVQYEKCIVIPRSGCAGCVSSAMNFVITNIDSLDETLVIFTGVEDLKLLKLMLGNKILGKKNVFVDTSGMVPANIYFPTLIHLSGGEIRRSERYLVNQFYSN